jgi:hypothetical protein
MTLQNDKFDLEQAAAFDITQAEENNYNKNIMEYWVFSFAERFEGDGFDPDTARMLAKSLIQSVISFAHLPIEERRERVDAYERQRTAKEWAKISKKEVTI